MENLPGRETDGSQDFRASPKPLRGTGKSLAQPAGSNALAQLVAMPATSAFLVSVEVPDWQTCQDYWGEQNPDPAVGYGYTLFFFATSKYVTGIKVLMYIDMSL